MAMKKSRSERRKARAALLSRAATARVAGSRGGRRHKAKRSAVRTYLLAASAVAILGLGLIVAPKQAHAAGQIGAPEIDPGSMAGALTLLVGGLLVLTDRTRRA